MSDYAISITPSDVTHTSAVLTVHIDSSGSRVTEVSVHLGTSNKPFSDELAKFDFRPILEIVTLLSRRQLPGSCLSTTGQADSPASSAAQSDGHGSAAQPGSNLLPASLRTQSKQTSQGQVTAANKAPRGSVPPAATKSRWEDTPSDLAVVYWRERTIARVADYYSVPRHIAQRWIKLLRQGGSVPNPWPGQPPRSRLPSRRRKQ